MKLQNEREREAFTLIELLVVIAIIGVLAGILLPSLARAKQTARITQATTEILGIKGAVEQYYSAYNRYPTPQWVRKQGIEPVQFPDYTFGTLGVSEPGSLAYLPKEGPGTSIPVNPGSLPQTNNSAMMYILMDVDAGDPMVLGDEKRGNEENRRGTVFLNVKGGGGSANSPGLGEDYVYRDPWGSPYIISVDLNYDQQTRDVFYRNGTVALDASGKPLVGLVRTSDRRVKGNEGFEVRDPVAIWSLGPDRQASQAQRANVGVNKDNILSWQ